MQTLRLRLYGVQKRFRTNRIVSVKLVRVFSRRLCSVTPLKCKGRDLGVVAPKQGGGRGLEPAAHSRWLEVKGPQGYGEPKEHLFHVLRP